MPALTSEAAAERSVTKTVVFMLLMMVMDMEMEMGMNGYIVA